MHPYLIRYLGAIYPENLLLKTRTPIYHTACISNHNKQLRHKSIMFPLIVPHLYIVVAVVVASLFPLSYRSWHKESHDLMQKLAEEGHETPRDEDDDCITLVALRDRILKLPVVVQKWLESALALPSKTSSNDKTMIPFARALRIEQEGEFLLDDAWIPFTATQEFSARQTHPGFVWDAKMKKPCFSNLSAPILVRDAYIHGVGGMMKAQLPLGIPIVSMKDTDDLNLGEPDIEILSMIDEVLKSH
jgi:hypothetical protein